LAAVDVMAKILLALTPNKVDALPISFDVGEKDVPMSVEYNVTVLYFR